VFTKEGRISLRTSKYAEDFAPIDTDCHCLTCQHHSRAYLHHLMRAKESAGGTLLSIHNITYLLQETKRCRQAILEGKFHIYFEAACQQQNNGKGDVLSRS
jgi:queuine tRNA-ribosyltransferase